MSCEVLIQKIDQVIRSLSLIRLRLTSEEKLDLEGRRLGSQNALALDEIWIKYEDMFMNGLLREMQAKVKQIVNEQQLGKSAQASQQDIQHILDEQDHQPQDFQRWKTFMKHFRSGQSQFTAYGEDLTYLREKYLNFSDINQNQNDQPLTKSLNPHISNRENYQNIAQTVQVQTQTEQFDMALYQSPYDQKRSENENEKYSSNFKLPKFFIPSIKYSPSPVVSYKQFQNFSAQSQIKEKLPFLHTTNQSCLSQNFHQFALYSVNTLLLVLKNMEYLLPIGYITEISQNLMDCRTLIKNSQHLQERQFDMIQKVYKKVVKRMKTFRKQIKKDYQESKFIDINQKILIKIN